MSISWEDYNRSLGRDPNWRPPGTPAAPVPQAQPQQNISWDAYNQALGRPPGTTIPQQPYVQPQQQYPPQQPQQNISWDAYNQALGRPPGTTIPQQPYVQPQQQYIPPQQPQMAPAPPQGLSWEQYNIALGRPAAWRPGMPIPNVIAPAAPPPSISWEQYNIALGRPANYRPPGVPLTPQPQQPQMAPAPPGGLSWEQYNIALGRPAAWRPGMPIPNVIAPAAPPPSISWEQYNIALGRPANYRPPGVPLTPQQPQAAPAPPGGLSWEQYNIALGRPAAWRPGMPIPNVIAPAAPPPSISWEQYNIALGRPANYRPPGVPLVPTQPVAAGPEPPVGGLTWEQYNIALGRLPSWRPGQPVPPPVTVERTVPPPGLTWEQYNRALGRPVDYRPPGAMGAYVPPTVGADTPPPIRRRVKRDASLQMGSAEYSGVFEWAEKLVAFIPGFGNIAAIGVWYFAKKLPNNSQTVSAFVKEEIQKALAVFNNTLIIQQLENFTRTCDYLADSREYYQQLMSESPNDPEVDLVAQEINTYTHAALERGRDLYDALLKVPKPNSPLDANHPVVTVSFVILVTLVECIKAGSAWKFSKDMLRRFAVEVNDKATQLREGGWIGAKSLDRQTSDTARALVFFLNEYSRSWASVVNAQYVSEPNGTRGEIVTAKQTNSTFTVQELNVQYILCADIFGWQDITGSGGNHTFTPEQLAIGPQKGIIRDSGIFSPNSVQISSPKTATITIRPGLRGETLYIKVLFEEAIFAADGSGMSGYRQGTPLEWIISESKHGGADVGIAGTDDAYTVTPQTNFGLKYQTGVKKQTMGQFLKIYHADILGETKSFFVSFARGNWVIAHIEVTLFADVRDN